MNNKHPNPAAVKLGAMRLLAVALVSFSLITGNWIVFAGGMVFLIFVFRVKAK